MKCCSTLHSWKEQLTSIKEISNFSESGPEQAGKKAEGVVQANSWLVTPSNVKLGIGNIKGLVEWWHLRAGNKRSPRAYRLSGLDVT